MQKHYLADIIEPVIDALGYDTVRILTIGDSNPTIQIMIEHKDYEKELTVDDCAKVSRAISAVMDEKDPIENKYTLEVVMKFFENKRKYPKLKKYFFYQSL